MVVLGLIFSVYIHTTKQKTTGALIANKAPVLQQPIIKRDIPFKEEIVAVNLTTAEKNRVISSSESIINISLDVKTKQYESEFLINQFDNLSEYHNIVTLCNAMPSNDSEFDYWLSKHSNDEGLDIEYMVLQVEQCNNVSRKNYQQLEKLYRKAIDYGDKKAKLTLAKLIPFVSPEKIQLLSESSSLSIESVDMLAEIALKGGDYIPAYERFFWLTISNSSTLYPQKHALVMNELYSEVDNYKLKTLNDLIANWDNASDQSKERIIKELKKI
jgi:hypothetical protein